MKPLFRHIPAIAFAFIMLFSSCSSKEEKIIPRNKLSHIYAEMFVTDQWIKSTPDVRRLADTSMVYEPILQKYGYTSEDYRRSVDKYLDDPDRFARILRTSVEIIDKRIKELEVLQAEAEEAAKRKSSVIIDFKIGDHFPFMEDPRVIYYDSLAVEIDSLTWEYRIVPVEVSDTIYEGVQMIIRTDSLSVSDSLAGKDLMENIDEPAIIEKFDGNVEEVSETVNRLRRERELPLRQKHRPSIDMDASKKATDIQLLEEVKEMKYER